MALSLTDDEKRRLKEAAERAKNQKVLPEDRPGLPLISEEAVARVRASSFITKEEREALGIHSRWMVWAIRNGKRRVKGNEEAPEDNL